MTPATVGRLYVVISSYWARRLPTYSPSSRTPAAPTPNARLRSGRFETASALRIATTATCRGLYTYGSFASTSAYALPMRLYVDIFISPDGCIWSPIEQRAPCEIDRAAS